MQAADQVGTCSCTTSGDTKECPFETPDAELGDKPGAMSPDPAPQQGSVTVQLSVTPVFTIRLADTWVSVQINFRLETKVSAGCDLIEPGKTDPTAIALRVTFHVDAFIFGVLHLYHDVSATKVAAETQRVLCRMNRGMLNEVARLCAKGLVGHQSIADDTTDVIQIATDSDDARGQIGDGDPLRWHRGRRRRSHCSSSSRLGHLLMYPG